MKWISRRIIGVTRLLLQRKRKDEERNVGGLKFMERNKIVLFAILLTVLLLAVALPYPVVVAAAPVPVPITITAEKEAWYVGQKITVTVHMGNTGSGSLAGFMFNLELDGLVLDTKSKPPVVTASVVPESWARNFDVIARGDKTVYQLSSVYFIESLESPELPLYTGGGGPIATFVCTATKAGRFTVTLSDVLLCSEPATIVLATDADVTGFTFTVTEPLFIYGDVNGDGKVNAADIVLLARYVARWPGIHIHLEAADVNGDGNVNSSDTIILARHVARWPAYETLPYNPQ